MSPYEHYFQGKAQASYGRKTGLVVSLLIHLVVLGGLTLISYAGTHKREEFPGVMKVRIGGPKNLNVSGRKSKAPVAGVTRAKPKPKQKATKKKTPPKKTDKKQIGLDRKKTKPTPPKQSADPVPDRGKGAPPAEAEVVPPIDDQKGPEALGSTRTIQGSNGVSVEIGDGSQDVDIQDIEFISYFRTVIAEINNRWIKRGLEGGTTRVRFYIDREGAVSGVKIVQSSGKPHLDSPARRAVLGADLPPLPQGYQGDRLILNINFQYGN